MTHVTDIDIDFANRSLALTDLHHVPAVTDSARAQHPSGVYFQDIPTDPLDGRAVWDHRTAAEKGFFKIDFLNNSIYQRVRDEQHVVELLTREPPWDRLAEPAVVASLAQINNHFEIVKRVKPHSIYELAICIALIRPGKRRLINQPWDTICKEIWQPSNDYFYKRSHAIAYAASIVIQFNSLIESGEL